MLNQLPVRLGRESKNPEKRYRNVTFHVGLCGGAIMNFVTLRELANEFDHSNFGVDRCYVFEL